MDFKPKAVKYEVNILRPGRAFDTVRHIDDKLVGFFSYDISREELFSPRTGAACKYTRTDGSKICNTNVLQIQKRSSSPCTKGKSSSISLFSKSGGEEGDDKKSTYGTGGERNMRTLFSQLYHTYSKFLQGTKFPEKCFRTK